MTSSQERIDRVEKLKDDNYQFWSFQTKMFLQSKDLWDGIMDGSGVPARPGLQPLVARLANELDGAYEARQAAAMQPYEAAVAAFNEHHKKDRGLTE